MNGSAPSALTQPWQATAPTTLQARVALTVAALIIVGVSYSGGWALTVLAESPFIAPTRDEPGLWWLMAIGWWLGCTMAAWVATLAAVRVAHLTGSRLRRWRITTVALTVGTWLVVLAMYVANPLTIRRWQRYLGHG